MSFRKTYFSSNRMALCGYILCLCPVEILEYNLRYLAGTKEPSTRKWHRINFEIAVHFCWRNSSPKSKRISMWSHGNLNQSLCYSFSSALYESNKSSTPSCKRCISDSWVCAKILSLSFRQTFGLCEPDRRIFCLTQRDSIYLFNTWH